MFDIPYRDASGTVHDLEQLLSASLRRPHEGSRSIQSRPALQLRTCGGGVIEPGLEHAKPSLSVVADIRAIEWCAVPASSYYGVGSLANRTVRDISPSRVLVDISLANREIYHNTIYHEVKTPALLGVLLIRFSDKVRMRYTDSI